MANYLEPQRGVVDAGGSLSNAWELIKQRYWMFIGIAFLTFIMTSYLYCISWFIMGPVMGGVYYVVFRAMRGESVEFGMMFKGFDKFVPLMVVGLIQSIPRILGDIAGIAANFAQLAMMPMLDNNRDFFQSSGAPFAITGAIIAIFLVVIVVFIIFAFAWRVAFFCAIPLMLENDLSPGEAIKLSMRAGFSNTGGLVALIILEGLIMFGSFLLICVGLFFIGIPLWYVADAFAYRLIFPHMERNMNMAPPPPTAYGDFGGRMA
jgi:uncharacterized membrane protein